MIFDFLKADICSGCSPFPKHLCLLLGLNWDLMFMYWILFHFQLWLHFIQTLLTTNMYPCSHIWGVLLQENKSKSTTHRDRKDWTWLTSASQTETVSSLAEQLHSRLQAADPRPEQKSACCCSSTLLCHSCSRNSSFSWTSIHVDSVQCHIQQVINDSMA